MKLNGVVIKNSIEVQEKKTTSWHNINIDSKRFAKTFHRNLNGWMDYYDLRLSEIKVSIQTEWRRCKGTTQIIDDISTAWLLDEIGLWNSEK